MELMKGGMKDHAHAEATIPPIDGKIPRFWDPIPVSPDTVETTTDFAGDDEEVNFPADAFGASLSGSFNFDLFTLGFKVCAVTSRLSVFLLRFLPDSYRFKAAIGAHELILFFRPLFVGGEHLLKLLERRGVGWCVGRGYVRCWSMEISAAASVKRSLHVIRVVS
uniref:Uncharacterized protein n=1 Tax=Brassica oleracea var. oleracea TaxID=109376 RepID=A0A0D3ASS3_BRAOL